MTELDEARGRAAATYNAAADSYDDSANSFWDRFGSRTIERLNLKQGADVLDVCCGSGASAIPAARAVGPEGSVLGIDLAEKLLAVARAKAEVHGLHNVKFRTGDMLDSGLPNSSFDAVVCVFGIFFVPDMAAAVRELWKLVRPGGQLAITTWGPRFFEPGNSAFWNAVREVAPELHKGFNPWDRITDPPSVQKLLRDAGIQQSESCAESGQHAIPSPEAWWSAVLGSGYRGTLERLDGQARDHVRASNLAFIRNEAVRSVEANVVYAVANKANAQHR
jgi:ubiquinone/menaquinone biosynthesis C-methylase UbiE